MSSPTVNVKLRENKKGLAQDPIYYKGKELWDPPHGLESFPSLNLYVSWRVKRTVLDKSILSPPDGIQELQRKEKEIRDDL